MNEVRPDAPAVAHGFPAALQPAVAEVARILPPAEHPALGSINAIVRGERVVFAQRIYNPEIRPTRLARLGRDQQLVAHCVYSRRHDGQVRQRSCEQIVRVAEPWIAPYVVYLAGEYVVEIVELIRFDLGDLTLPESPFNATYGEFAHRNPTFVDLVYQRATSYWNCYYRDRYARGDYPGIVLASALRLAAEIASREGAEQAPHAIPRANDVDPPDGV